MKKITFLFFLLTGIIHVARSQIVIPLYKDNIPNSIQSPNRESVVVRDNNEIISKISIPTLTAYLPPKEKANGTAVIICPGGGYWVLVNKTEGTDIAKKLNELGITAFVLKYRIPDPLTMDSTQIGPLQDAQQAMKIVRMHADEWLINPNRIGILGFSAGGHLAALTGTQFHKTIIPNPERTSVRPDFMILIYSVISLMEGIGDIGMRNQLLGKQASLSLIKEYSCEWQVSNQTPPTFIVCASDDKLIVPQNLEFYHALLKHKVPTELHIYQEGGHGFGLHLKKSKDEWYERCQNWLSSNGWL